MHRIRKGAPRKLSAGAPGPCPALPAARTAPVPLPRRRARRRAALCTRGTPVPPPDRAAPLLPHPLPVAPGFRVTPCPRHPPHPNPPHPNPTLPALHTSPHSTPPRPTHPTHPIPPLPAHAAQVLRDCGVRVLTVREILAHGVGEHVGARLALEQLAAATLAYTVGWGWTLYETPLLGCAGRGGRLLWEWMGVGDERGGDCREGDEGRDRGASGGAGLGKGARFLWVGERLWGWPSPSRWRRRPHYRT
jgi:hypothetical protein